MTSASKYLAELLGTFLFLLIGYASVAGFNQTAVPVSGLLIVPFSFGLGLLAAIAAFGHISGGHFNPAVTIAMVLDKRTTPVNAVGYIIAQIIGAIAAALVILLTVSQGAVSAGITKPNGISDVGALILETIFTAIFVAVILTASKRAGSLAAIFIPLTLVAIHFAIANLTGSSVNPARSIGSAVVGGDLTGLWIYIVGPIIGGAIAYGIFRLMERTEEEPAGPVA